MPIEVTNDLRARQVAWEALYLADNENGPYFGTGLQNLEETVAAGRLLRRTKVYSCALNNHKYYAYFWMTESVATHFLELRRVLYQLSANQGNKLGLAVSEVMLSPEYTHSSPFDPDGQRVLIPDWIHHLYAWWCRREFAAAPGNCEMVPGREGSTPERRAAIRKNWSLLNPEFSHLDAVLSGYEAAFRRVEPPNTLPPEPDYPLPVMRETPTQRNREMVARWHQYERTLAQWRSAIALPVRLGIAKQLGCVDIWIKNEGIVLSRQDRPEYKTPVLPWKLFKRAIPKVDFSKQTFTGAPRRRVLLELPEEKR
jgi:hypothetical protein